MGQGQSAADLTALTDQQILALRASVSAWDEVVRRAAAAGADSYQLGLLRSEFYWHWALLGWPGDPIPGLEESTVTPNSVRVSTWYTEHVVRPLEARGYDSQPYAWPLIGILQDGSGPPSMKKVLDRVAEFVTFPALPAPFGKGAPAAIPTAFVTEAELEADWARQQAAITAAIEAQKAAVKIPTEAPPTPIIFFPSDSETITPAPRYPIETAPGAAGATAGTALLIGLGLLVLRGLFK